MKKTDLAYMSAIVDGEGAICLTKDGKHIKPQVQITNKRMELMNKAKELFGGGIYKDNKEGFECFVWKVGSHRDCVRILKLLMPYLLLKRDKADVVLRFCESRMKNKNIPYTKEEMKIYNEDWEKVRGIR